MARVRPSSSSSSFWGGGGLECGVSLGFLGVSGLMFGMKRWEKEEDAVVGDGRWGIVNVVEESGGSGGG